MASVVLSARAVLQATPRTRLLRLALGADPFPYAAGQAVQAGLPGSPLRKPYSIASAPSVAARTGLLELLVQIDEADPADPHLERVAPGGAVAVEGPFGSFRLPDPLAEPELLFVAGGTGISPLRAMMWEAFDRPGSRRVVVVYSARSPEEFAFREELTALADAGRIELHLTVTRGADQWGGRRGRIDTHLVEATLRTTDTRCFLCGPPALVADTTALLRKAGVDASRILSEKY